MTDSKECRRSVAPRAESPNVRVKLTYSEDVVKILSEKPDIERVLDTACLTSIFARAQDKDGNPNCKMKHGNILVALIEKLSMKEEDIPRGALEWFMVGCGGSGHCCPEAKTNWSKIDGPHLLVGWFEVTTDWETFEKVKWYYSATIVRENFVTDKLYL